MLNGFAEIVDGFDELELVERMTRNSPDRLGSYYDKAWMYGKAMRIAAMLMVWADEIMQEDEQ